MRDKDSLGRLRLFVEDFRRSQVQPLLPRDQWEDDEPDLYVIPLAIFACIVALVVASRVWEWVRF